MSSPYDDESVGAEGLPAPEYSHDEDRALVLVGHLREAREEKGWSAEDLSDRTRISLHVVVGLEHGDFGIVETPFVRAFLKTDAKAVGVPMEEVEDVFPEPKAVVEEPEEGEDVHAIPIPSRIRIPWRTIGRVLVAIVALGVLWTTEPWSWFVSDAPEPELVGAAPSESLPLPAIVVSTDSVTGRVDTIDTPNPGLEGEPELRERKEAPPPPPPGAWSPPSTTPAAIKVARFAVAARDSVWIQMVDALTEDVRYDSFLPPGGRREWVLSDTVQVTLGRHWAVAMSLDGDTLDVPGQAGRNVSVFLIGPSGVIGR